MRKITKNWLFGSILLVLASIKAEPVMLGDLQEAAEEIAMFDQSPLELALEAQERFILCVELFLGGEDWIIGREEVMQNISVARRDVNCLLEEKGYDAKVVRAVLGVFDQAADTGIELDLLKVLKSADNFAAWLNFARNGKGEQADTLRWQICNKNKLRDMFLTYMQQEGANFGEVTKLFEEDYHTMATVELVRKWHRELCV